jgi:hypothetical protein
VRPARTKAVFSITPVNSWAVLINSSSIANVVLIVPPCTQFYHQMMSFPVEVIKDEKSEMRWMGIVVSSAR